MTTTTWKEALASDIEPMLAEEIDSFETQMELRRRGMLDEKVFAEIRLRRGIYGQRYDNGQRHDGTETRTLHYPSGETTKGPTTLWDAPGMQRIKIPFGEMSAEQLELLADVAEEYSDAIVHVTTRQDVQLHFVHIEDTPDLMRRLAAVGITTLEACGNVVRNITGCPLAGVCRDESFDISPYAAVLTRFLLGHEDAQDFGRKFKISFSGCDDHACGLANMHDIGYVARRRPTPDGGTERGFRMLVGGGLGAVPHQAKAFAEFVPEAEILPLAQAICRVFARLGEKKNRARARLKFLVAKLGLEEFRRLVLEERERLPEDPRWTSWIDEVEEEPAPHRPRAISSEAEADLPEVYREWRRTNVAAQRQDGFFLAAVTLPLGDASSDQMRRLATIARRFSGGKVRASVEQNFLLRWLREGDLPEVWKALDQAGLGDAGAATLVDITACPGTDTCKLGIASSRGLAAELRQRVITGGYLADQAVGGLSIKISGCFNSCGQHHVADIGFYGSSRRVGSHAVPHFQVVLGGRWDQNAGAFGLAIVAIPAKRVPEAVERIVALYLAERQKGEGFHDCMQRLGRAALRAALTDITTVPPYSEQPDAYTDWRDSREFTLGDMGVGECAGEVVSGAEFGLADSERQVFEAQVHLDEDRPAEAADQAYRAMLAAARAVTQIEDPNVGKEPESIVGRFRDRLFDTGLFHDPFAGPKFANFLFAAHGSALESPDTDRARQRIEEAQLFIEAAHACYQRQSRVRAAG